MAEKKQNYEPTTVERLLGACKREPQEQLLLFKSWTDETGAPVVVRARDTADACWQRYRCGGYHSGCG